MDHTLDILPGLTAFRDRFPAPQAAAFLIMRFAESEPLEALRSVLVDVLRDEGISLCRADEMHFADDLWSNVRILMEGCGFGLAIFEQSHTRDFNPNVALEVGYLMARQKPVCILKEQSVPSVPSDLLHRLYIEYSHFKLPGKLPEQLRRWLRDSRLTRPCRLVTVSFRGNAPNLYAAEMLQGIASGIVFFVGRHGVIRLKGTDCDSVTERCRLYFDADSFASQYLQGRERELGSMAGLEDVTIDSGFIEAATRSPTNIAFWEKRKSSTLGTTLWQACLREAFSGLGALAIAAKGVLPEPTNEVEAIAVYITRASGRWYIQSNFQPIGHIFCAKLVVTELSSLAEIPPVLQSLNRQTADLDTESRLVDYPKLLDAHIRRIRYILDPHVVPNLRDLPFDSGGATQIEVLPQSLHA